MIRLSGCVAVLLLLPLVLSGEEKKAVAKPMGTYVREVGGRTLSMTFKSDSVLIRVKDDTIDIAVHAAAAVDGDVLFANVNKVEKKGTESGPEKRDLFSFQFALSKGELTVSNLKGTNINEESQKLVEGVYRKE